MPAINENTGSIVAGGRIDLKAMIDNGLLPREFKIIWGTDEKIDLAYAADPQIANKVVEGLNYAIKHGWDPSVL